MPASVVWRLLADWLAELKALWVRGLVLLHSSTVGFTAGTLVDKLAGHYDSVTCIAPRELRGVLSGRCRRVLSPSAISELLGTENDAVLAVIPGLLRPNLIAAAAETVKGGGVLALVVPSLDSWQPGGKASLGFYKRYLVESLYTLESIFWADADSGIVYSARLPGQPGRKPEGPGGYKPVSPVHRKLIEACETREQAEALDRIVLHLRSRGRSVLILGDRGRGKSGLLGLAVAYIVASHMAGFIPVTAPGPHSVQSFFRVLDKALRILGVKHWLIERGPYIIGVAGPWFHVRYHTPDRVEPGSFTVVDEAAALGPLRLRLIVRRAPRVLAATTIHGYEGSGRILAKVAANILREPRLIVELKSPIRYAAGDPLERWVYGTFMLRVEEEPPPSVEAGSIVFEEAERERLVSDRGLLKSIYSILALAHYRNEPDDLALILDAPHHRIFMLRTQEGRAVAVAQVSAEEPETPVEWRILPDILAQYTPEAGRLKGWRIVRIAVHPQLQRRGLGSILLKHLEGKAAAEGFDWIGAVFGRPDVIRFWVRNGYSPVYISPLPNKLTGEHNIAVVKPLTAKAKCVLDAVTASARKRFLLASHSLYRGVPAETLLELLAAPAPPQQPLSELDEAQRYRAKLAVSGVLDVESVLDVAWLCTVNAILKNGGLSGLTRDEGAVLVMRVLQGKSISEVASALNTDVEKARELLRAVVLKLVRGCL